MLRIALGLILISTVFSDWAMGQSLKGNCDINCIYCEDIDGFSTAYENGQAGTGPSDFCTLNQHQVTWIGFVAGSTDLCIQVDVTDCSGGNNPRLEIGIVEANDCSNASVISNCYGGSNRNAIREGRSGVVTADKELVIGKYYFLVFDMTGFAPNACAFSLSVICGSTGAPVLDTPPVLEEDVQICDYESYNFQADVFGACDYLWELDDVEVANSLDYTFEPTNVGIYTLCATPFNFCEVGPKGCTTIKVGEPTEEYVDLLACKEDCTEYNGITYCDEGIVELDYENYLGCDSTIILNVLWHNPDPYNYLGEIQLCAGEEYEINGESFDREGTYEVYNEDIYGCDEITEFDLIVLDSIKTEINKSLCAPEFYILGTDTLRDSGTFIKKFVSDQGCDSLVRAELIFNPSYEIPLQEIICNGQDVTIGGRSFNRTGLYTIELKSRAGCDSIIFLDLLQSDTIYRYYSQQICDDNFYTFGDTTLRTSGVYRRSYLSAVGCDSIEVVDLEVYPTHESYLQESICTGEGYEINGEIFSTSGLFQLELLSRENCDSIITLDLIVIEHQEEYLQLELCQGDSIEFNQVYYSEALSEIFTFDAANGCDSTIIFDLSITDSYDISLSETICSGDSILFDNGYVKDRGITNPYSVLQVDVIA